MQVISSRKVDELGRIVLPEVLRQEYDITSGDEFIFCINNLGQIVLQRKEPCCKLCKDTKNLHELKGKNIYVCTSCREKIINA